MRWTSSGERRTSLRAVVPVIVMRQNATDPACAAACVAVSSASATRTHARRRDDGTSGIGRHRGRRLKTPCQSRECPAWTIGSIRAVSRLTERAFSDSAQPLPPSTARMRPLWAAILRQPGRTWQGKMHRRGNGSALSRLPSQRDAIPSRGGRIGGHLATDPRSGGGGGVVAVRGAARERWKGARGVARCAGSPTSGQSAPRGAAAHRNAYRPGRRGQTSTASARPTDTRQPGSAVRSSRSHLPGLPPRKHRLRLRSPERSRRATPRAARTP